LGILAASVEKTMSSLIGGPARFPGRIGGGVVGIVVAASLALAACGGAPKPTLVSATLQAGTAVNPDLRKRPSPIVIRVYELKSAAAFDGADFVSLFERDQATLAAEMSAREEFILRPGETRMWDKTTAPDTKFIGVMASFRDIERARWKSIVAIKPGVKNLITVRADDIGVEAKLVSP
jgi:type VI secretion system protein VasD